MPSKSISLVNYYNLESPFATEFRRLLHRLRTADGGEEKKAILVSSAVVGEGKSTVCTFLALTAARKGMKTLLMDSDLRRPTLHRLFDLPREQGLSEVLGEGLSVKRAIKKTELEKLDVITAGKSVSNPAEVLDAVETGRIIAEMKFFYDLVFIDSAPIIPVSDPMLLAPETDGVLIVVKAGDTQRAVVERSLNIIRSAGSHLVGVVLNNITRTLPHYYSEDYYGYEYPNSHGAGKAAPRKGGSKNARMSGSGKASPAAEFHPDKG